MTCRSTRTSLRVLAAAILPIALIAVVPHAAQANRSNYPTNEVVAGTASIGAAHVCYIVSGGTVKCWGFNRDGQLGNGTGGSGTDVAQGSDTTVSGITNAVAVSAGLFNTCALLSDGTIKCWG